MSDYLHQKGYIYPLGKLSDEENNSIYKKIKGEENFELDKDKFELEYMGKNDYLIWLTYSTYGEKSDEFGSCRFCNQQEIYYHAPKFREILGEIDTAKLKYIDFCYYNSTECTTDYYLSEPEVSETDAIQAAIQHCKTQAPRNCGVMYEQYTAVAEWLQELAAFKDETPITVNWLLANNFFGNGMYCYTRHLDDITIEITTTIDEFVFVEIFGDGINRNCDIRTVGQLRMFLTLCGSGDFVKQLKN